MKKFGFFALLGFLCLTAVAQAGDFKGVIPGSSGGNGTVTSVSVATANGLGGTVANATTTPAITLSTSVNGIAKGNGTTFSTATPGTDYLSTLTGDVTSVGNATTLHAARVAGQDVWEPIFFRGRSINGTAGCAAITVSGTAGVNTQTIGWTPLNTPITATRVVFADFDETSTGLAYRPSTEIWTGLSASLNYQQKDTVPPAYTWNGAATTTLNPSQTPSQKGFIISDPLVYMVPANTQFGIRASAGIAVTTTVCGADYINTILGSISDTRFVSGVLSGGGGVSVTGFTEYDSRLGTGYASHTGDNTNVSSTGAFYTLTPAIVLALMHPTNISVGIIGDSLMQGQMGYVADAFGNYGFIEQGFQNKFPWVNFSRGTMQAAQFNTSALKDGILKLITGSQMYLTDLIMGLGRNDISAGHSAATVQADVASASLEYQQQGIAVHVMTVPPWTASQDTWATTGNQFYIYANSNSSGSTASGSGTITQSTSGAPSGFTNGMLIATQYGTCIAPGTTATISGTTITLSQNTTCIIATGNQLQFGNSTPNTYTSTAITYNAALRANFNQPSYNNNGFTYQSVLDTGGTIGAVSGSDFKWVANDTGDGIHPNQTGGTALIAAGIPGTTARFGLAR